LSARSIEASDQISIGLGATSDTHGVFTILGVAEQDQVDIKRQYVLHRGQDLSQRLEISHAKHTVSEPLGEILLLREKDYIPLRRHFWRRSWNMKLQVYYQRRSRQSLVIQKDGSGFRETHLTSEDQAGAKTSQSS